jgi:hypothetical protein
MNVPTVEHQRTTTDHKPQTTEKKVRMQDIAPKSKMTLYQIINDQKEYIMIEIEKPILITNIYYTLYATYTVSMLVRHVARSTENTVYNTVWPK